MANKPKLKVFRSLAPQNSVGWLRSDLPMVHVFAQALPGETFRPSNGPEGGPHWPCIVCEYHGYTQEDFHSDMLELMGGDVNRITRENPITHGGTDRGYKMCQCSRCKRVSECTPSNDFYGGEGDPLLCWACMLAGEQTCH
jgi:hypothetical protein